MTVSMQAAEPFVLPGATRRRLTSTAPVAGDWEVSVALPTSPFAGPGPYPTLYVLDPFGTFATTAHVAATLGLLSLGALPPVAVVGVGPATDDPLELMVQRTRDLTPSEWSHAAVAGLDAMGTGGAPAFLDLLVDHVLPALEAELPLDHDDRALGGWSFGGLFTSFALLRRPEAFRRYLAVSPSLWWHDGELLDPDLVAGADLAGRSVHLAVGEHESNRDVERVWPPVPPERFEMMQEVDMVADLERFAELLRARGDVRLSTDVVADEQHTSVWPAAVTRGLLRLYASPAT